MMPKGVLRQMAWDIWDGGNQIEMCYAFKRPAQLGCGSSDKNSRFLGVSISFQFSSVKLLSCVQLFETPVDCSMPGFPVCHQLPKLAQTLVRWIVMPSNHLILWLLFLPSVFLSIRIFSNESVLHIKWPKYWNFSFSISPSNEYSGLISFRID